MEATLGLLAGTGSSGVSSNESAVSKVEAFDVGLSSEATSYPEEAELELGLSLGGGRNGGAKVKPSACRILTAKDFPSHASSPVFAVSGTKRAADSRPQDASSPPRSSQVVGWPPIRAYRMNSLVNQAKTPKAEEDKAVDEKGNDNKSKTGVKAKEHVGFIKVNMDGIGIGRKVDLNAHASYETLAQALEDMFFNKPTAKICPIGSLVEKEHPMKSPKLLDGSSEFVLTYEDKEGDWMLVGDVPWRMFISTVKRLRIMRTSEANGLAPRVQDTNERQRRKPI